MSKVCTSDVKVLKKFGIDTSAKSIDSIDTSIDTVPYNITISDISDKLKNFLKEMFEMVSKH